MEMFASIKTGITLACAGVAIGYFIIKRPLHYGDLQVKIIVKDAGEHRFSRDIKYYQCKRCSTENKSIYHISVDTRLWEAVPKQVSPGIYSNSITCPEYKVKHSGGYTTENGNPRPYDAEALESIMQKMDFSTPPVIEEGKYFFGWRTINSDNTRS